MKTIGRNIAYFVAFLILLAALIEGVSQSGSYLVKETEFGRAWYIEARFNQLAGMRSETNGGAPFHTLTDAQQASSIVAVLLIADEMNISDSEASSYLIPSSQKHE